MRRIPACLFVVVALALLLPAAAFAATNATHVTGARTGAGHSPQLPAKGHNRSVIALATGSYDISGTVLDGQGDATTGADVNWGWLDPANGYQPGGDSGVLAGDAFTFSNVSSQPGADDLQAVFDHAYLTPEFVESWTNDFSANNDSTSYSYVVQPAGVDLQIAGAPASFQPQVDTFGQDGMAQDWPYVGNGTGVTVATPPSFDDVVASDVKATAVPGDTRVTTAAEWLATSDVPVTAGVVAPDPVALDWGAAQHAYLNGAVCQHSGKPGTVVTMVVKGWPTGEKAAFELDGYPMSATKVTSAGPSHTYLVKLTIPKTAHVGRVYGLSTYRWDAAASGLSFTDYFQVCTLTPSAASIGHGKAVRLSGKVPTTSGTVYLYSRHTSAGQPSSTTSVKGWVKVGHYTLKGGKFVTGYLHPTRTTWYVLRYGSGHGAAFAGYTSVAKVTVH